MGEEDLKADEEEKQRQDEEENVAVVPVMREVEDEEEQGEEKVVDGQQHEVKDIGEYVSRLNDDKWPNVNGVYDAQGEWHDWNEMTYSYTYGETELIILPYTVCSINLSGSQQQQQQLAAASTT